MALSADTPRDYELGVGPDFNHLPAQVDVTYAGSACTIDASGDVGPALTSESFVGFATQQIDNSAGSAGAVEVQIRQRGVVKLTVAGVTGDSDVGSAVYLTDDNTFTLTASGALQIGKVVRHVSSTTCFVYFEGALVRSI